MSKNYISAYRRLLSCIQEFQIDHLLPLTLIKKHVPSLNRCQSSGGEFREISPRKHDLNNIVKSENDEV